jgi:hypothetical protein
MRLNIVLAIFLSSLITACDEKDGPQNYDFSAVASQKVYSSSLSNLSLAESAQYKADNLCTSVFCITPSNASGKYFGVGLLIQSSGNGMSAYFDLESWSSVTEASETKLFDFSSPLTYSGNLNCCGGEGDLKNPNSYFSDVAYMFASIDVEFSITEAMGAHGTAIGTHQLRFVFADNASTTAKRGDIMIKDGTDYKWVDAEGNLSATRPGSPITMNDQVVNWTNPFGEGKGNQTIPVVYAGLAETDGKLVTSEDEMKEPATYSFNFNALGLVIFPDILHADVGMLDSRLAMLKKIHILGMPYGTRGVIGVGKTDLTIE